MLRQLAGKHREERKRRAGIAVASIAERRVISLGNVLKNQTKAAEDALIVARKGILLANVKNLVKILEAQVRNLAHASIVERMVISLVNDPEMNQADLQVTPDLLHARMSGVAQHPSGFNSN